MHSRDFNGGGKRIGTEDMEHTIKETKTNIPKSLWTSILQSLAFSPLRTTN